VLAQGLVLRLTLREPDRGGTRGGPLPVGRRAEG
jgi:hypothetical protein